MTLTGLVDVPTVARSMAELREIDPDMAAYVTEFAADSVIYQMKETGKMTHEQEHVRPKRARDTRALSPLRPQFGSSNKVVPIYSQVHADIDSGASMTMTPHASLISEGQQCNMSKNWPMVLY